MTSELPTQNRFIQIRHFTQLISTCKNTWNKAGRIDRMVFSGSAFFVAASALALGVSALMGPASCAVTAVAMLSLPI
jgi:hypothetical protein